MRILICLLLSFVGCLGQEPTQTEWNRLFAKYQGAGDSVARKKWLGEYNNLCERQRIADQKKHLDPSFTFWGDAEMAFNPERVLSEGYLLSFRTEKDGSRSVKFGPKVVFRQLPDGWLNLKIEPLPIPKDPPVGESGVLICGLCGNRMHVEAIPCPDNILGCAVYHTRWTHNCQVKR